MRKHPARRGEGPRVRPSGKGRSGGAVVAFITKPVRETSVASRRRRDPNEQTRGLAAAPDHPREEVADEARRGAGKFRKVASF